MTKNYYYCWKLSLSALAYYKLLDKLDVFIVCLVVELSVASTNSSPVCSQQYAAPQQTCPSHAWIISWSVDCTCSSVERHHKLILFNCPPIIIFNKVSLPSDHHNLLTHWLGIHSDQYSMGVCWGLGHCDVPHWHQRSVVACCILLNGTGPSDTVRIYQATRCLFPSDRTRRHNPGLSS
jgi:hypothetical protein